MPEIHSRKAVFKYGKITKVRLCVKALWRRKDVETHLEMISMKFILINSNMSGNDGFYIHENSMPDSVRFKWREENILVWGLRNSDEGLCRSGCPEENLKKYPSCNLVTNKMLMSIIPSKNEFLFYLIEVDLDKIKNFALALLKIWWRSLNKNKAKRELFLIFKS